MVIFILYLLCFLVLKIMLWVYCQRQKKLIYFIFKVDYWVIIYFLKFIFSIYLLYLLVHILIFILILFISFECLQLYLQVIFQQLLLTFYSLKVMLNILHLFFLYLYNTYFFISIFFLSLKYSISFFFLLFIF